MAPSPDENKQARSYIQSSFSFVAFTQFVDEHISNILHSLVGLPSSLHNVSTWQSQREVGQNGRQDRSLDQIHHSQMDSIADSRAASNCNNLDSTQGQTPTSPLSEFEEAMVDGHRVRILSPTELDPPFLLPDDGIERCQASETLKRLKAYLDDSPYSPVQLEQDPNLQSYLPMWRSAFVDLMNFTQGGETCPGIAQNLYLHCNDFKPEAWKTLLLKNFSYIYHQNHMQRALNLLVSGHLSRTEEGTRNILEYIRLAQDDDLGHQRNFFTTFMEHYPNACPSLLVRLFMVAGDRRPRDDDYEARYLGYLQKDYTCGISWRVWKLSHEHNDQQFVSQNELFFPPVGSSKSQILDRLALSLLGPRPDGTMVFTQYLRTRFLDGSFEVKGRGMDVKDILDADEASKPGGTTKELQVDSHEADKPTKIKKGGWFWK